VLAIADRFETAVGVLGRLRTECQAPADPNLLRFCWVTDFPLFEGVDEEGRLMAAHHPFTMPHPADFGRLDSDPLSVRALAYDLVVNGWELGSGSVRVHRVELQRRLLGMLGIDAREAEARFGFLLRALAHGAPPHGGFAVGVDRLVAVLAEEDSIREVIAFPKTQSGADPLTGAPKPVPAALLAELGLAAVSEQGARERSSRAMR
jgi:aspartyl-tRNA synthetase